jgi:hypothetical protein
MPRRHESWATGAGSVVAGASDGIEEVEMVVGEEARGGLAAAT